MRKSILYRDRIHREIHEQMAYPVLFVLAPMGCGKSTAVRHYLEKYERDNIWVSALDNDDFRLWNNICDLIAVKRKSAGKSLRSIGFPMARYLLPQVIEALKQAVTEPLVLVIDDYHLLAEDSPIHHLLFAIAMEHIAGLRIICMARSIPNWLLVEMRAKELCAVISAETLAFDSAEVFLYLNQRKYIPSCASSASSADRIWAASEGWIAAVVLLAEGLRQGRDVSPLEGTHGLFEHILFQKLTKSEQTLLIKLAILDEFTLQQAEFVLRRKNVSQLVERLCAQNEFITYNIDSNTYKMHSLLRSYLEHKAAVHNINTNVTLLNLARWELSQGHYASSLKHYHQCGHGIEFFEKIAIEDRRHIPFESQDICYTIFKNVPLEIALRIPHVCLYVSLFFLASGVLERERFAMKSLHFLRRHFVEKGHDHPDKERILCELQIVTYVAHRNNSYFCMDLTKCQYREMLREVVAPFVHTVSLSAGLPSYLFSLYRKPGDLDAVVAFAEEHFDCECLGGLGYGFDKLLHAEKHLERAELDKARLCAEQAIKKGWLYEQVHIIACAHTTLARIALFEGNRCEAERQLNIIKYEILRNISFTMPADGALVYALMGELSALIIYSILRNTEHIRSCMPDINTFGKGYIYRGMGVPELLKIKLKILCKEFADAEVYCDYYETKYTRYPSQMGCLRYKVFRAVISAHLYGTDQAVSILRLAMEEAALDRVVMPFAENAEFILPLLKCITPTKRLPEGFLNQILTTCEGFCENFRLLQEPPTVNILTRRECEVFHLLAKGLSQKNIAASLHISAGTVKRHLENIYRKLGVNSRAAALDKGFMLGLKSH